MEPTSRLFWGESRAKIHSDYNTIWNLSCMNTKWQWDELLKWYYTWIFTVLQPFGILSDSESFESKPEPLRIMELSRVLTLESFWSRPFIIITLVFCLSFTARCSPLPRCLCVMKYPPVDSYYMWTCLHAYGHISPRVRVWAVRMVRYICSLMYNLEIGDKCQNIRRQHILVQGWSVAHRYNFRPRLLVAYGRHASINLQLWRMTWDLRAASSPNLTYYMCLNFINNLHSSIIDQGYPSLDQ